MDSSALFDRAAAAIRDKRHAEARQLLIKYVQLNPRSQEGWLALSSVMEDMDKAIDCLNRVLALNPNHQTAKEWLAFAEQEKARQAAVAEMDAEDVLAEIAIDEPGDEARPVPRLGKYLLQYKFITEGQLRAGLLAQRQAAAAGVSKRLGDILIEQGVITPDNLEFALNEQRKDGDRPVPRLGKYLVDYKFITEQQLQDALAAQREANEAGDPKRLGDVLLELGALTQERLSFAVREQSRSFYSLFND